jgi:hypothetical protein
MMQRRIFVLSTRIYGFMLSSKHRMPTNRMPRNRSSKTRTFSWRCRTSTGTEAKPYQHVYVRIFSTYQIQHIHHLCCVDRQYLTWNDCRITMNSAGGRLFSRSAGMTGLYFICHRTNDLRAIRRLNDYATFFLNSQVFLLFQKVILFLSGIPIKDCNGFRICFI